MASDASPPSEGGGRDLRRVGLLVVCLVAVAALVAALPVLSPDATASPAESLVPVPQQGAEGDGTAGTGGARLGALSPGDETSVGGPLGGTDALRSRSAEVHFVVESTEPAYWRTGAYGRYTGSGWERDGEPSERDNPLAPSRSDGQEVVYEVRLERTARALPTVWRPHRLSTAPVLLTDELSVTAKSAVPAGTSYSGVSYRPPQDEALLEGAGRDYPTSVGREYTQLPASTAAALGPTTERVTANASTPYETARAIERWLERTKSYSLNVSQPRGEDVAVQFVQEMEAGYCEYFATSMVAMLRTQDIPARYVVGYSTGQATGEDTYTVRGMNAHAWVEVYFPEVGWITFDPTPAADRLQAERQAYQEQREGQYQPGDEQDGDATPTAGGSDGTAAEGTGTDAGATGTGTGDAGTPGTGTGTDGDGEDGTGGDDGETGGDDDGGKTASAGEYDVRLNRSAVPGATVRVTISRSGSPVVDAMVLFNDDSIGRTDARGNVTGEVPYAEQLNVTVREGGGAPARSARSGPPLAVGASPRDGRFYTVAAQRGNDTATFDVETTARIAITGEPVTGATVGVRATVADLPVPDATVTVDGDPVARTDAQGQARVRLPTEPGVVDVGVQRDPVTGSRSISLPVLNVSASPVAGLALPGGSVTVKASIGNRSAAGAPVLVDGERVATTGVDGTASIRIRGLDRVTVAVEKYEQTATATTGWPLANLGLLGSGLAVLAVGLVVGARRAGIDLLAIRSAVRRAWVLFATGVLGVAGAVDATLERLEQRARRTAEHLRALQNGRRSAAALLALLTAWASERVDATHESIGRLRSNVSREPPVVANGTDGPTPVREAWQSLLENTSIDRPRTYTPGEIAGHATAVDGLPEDAVRTVVGAFRAVEYGGRDGAGLEGDLEQARRRLDGDEPGVDIDSTAPASTEGPDR